MSSTCSNTISKKARWKNNGILKNFLGTVTVIKKLEKLLWLVCFSCFQPCEERFVHLWLVYLKDLDVSFSILFTFIQ